MLEPIIPPAGVIQWFAYGQTQLTDNTQTINPAPNNNNLSVAGKCIEITSWPAVVPAGYSAQLVGQHIEAYDDVGTIVLFPFLGSGPASNANALATVSSKAGTRMLPVCFPLPAGTEINICLEDGEVNGVYSWSLWMWLIPVTPVS